MMTEEEEARMVDAHRQLVRECFRMRDDWAESDDRVKTQLWRNLFNACAESYDALNTAGLWPQDSMVIPNG